MDSDGEMVMGSLGWKQVTGWEVTLGKETKQRMSLTKFCLPLRFY